MYLRNVNEIIVYMRSLVFNNQCWGNLLLKVMHYNIALLPKKVTNYAFYGK